MQSDSFPATTSPARPQTSHRAYYESPRRLQTPLPKRRFLERIFSTHPQSAVRESVAMDRKRPHIRRVQFPPQSPPWPPKEASLHRKSPPPPPPTRPPQPPS